MGFKGNPEYLYWSMIESLPLDFPHFVCFHVKAHKICMYFFVTILSRVQFRAFHTGKIVVLTPHLVPPIRPDYFWVSSRNFKSGLFRVSQKKRNGGFAVHCELKVLYLFTSLDQTSSAEENDTKIMKFGWVVLILCPFLEIRSFSNFARYLRPMSEDLCRE